MSTLNDFENYTKSKNFVFSSGIDFIYEIFKIEKETKNKSFNKIFKILGKSKSFKNLLIKLADRGVNF